MSSQEEEQHEQEQEETVSSDDCLSGISDDDESLASLLAKYINKKRKVMDDAAKMHIPVPVKKHIVKVLRRFGVNKDTANKTVNAFASHDPEDEEYEGLVLYHFDVHNDGDYNFVLTVPVEDDVFIRKERRNIDVCTCNRSFPLAVATMVTGASNIAAIMKHHRPTRGTHDRTYFWSIRAEGEPIKFLTRNTVAELVTAIKKGSQAHP